jgi:hypothetical protein
LTFSQAITGLTTDHITLSGVSGAVKGTLSGSGTTYTLGISGFTSGGTLSVSVSSPSGYSVSGSPKTVTIYRAPQTVNAAFTVTFAQIVDIPDITGPTIYRTSSTPTSAAITLVNSSQYSDIRWYITGTSVTQTGGETFTITTAGNPVYNIIGKHFLTVEVTKGGIPYNKTIVFTVAQ